MTEIKYTHKSNSFEHAVKGHAEISQNKEPDIVCSAISALVSTLASKITELEKDNIFLKAPTVELKTGNVTIKATVSKGAEKQVLNYFDLITHGLHLIALEYPENARFIKN